MALPGPSERMGASTFRCPECVGELDCVADGLRCANCGTYPVLDGLPVFSRARDVYYGEIPKSEMQSILTRARATSWQEALLDHADRTGRMDFYRYATDNIRSAFEFLLNAPYGNVLDFGCGPGAVSIALARHAASVYATDLTYERVAFAQIRAAQEGLQNFHAFCGGDTKHLPVPDAFFDTVILDGVLEWLPAFSPGKPRDIQVTFLKEVHRVLKPQGLLFVAIENRIAFAYFRGAREHHTRLRYISLMPRLLANLYSRIASGKPLRPYTYTKSQFKRLFRDAGFDSSEFWGLLPDYRNIQTALDLSRSSMVRNALPVPESTLKRVRNAIATPMLPWLSDCFGIRVQRGSGTGEAAALNENGARSPFVYELLSHISEHYLNGEVLTPTKYSTSAHSVHVWAHGQKKYIVHLPLSAADETRMDRGVRAAAEIAKVTPIPTAPLVARSSYKGIGFAMNVLSEGSSVRSIFSSRSEICNVLAVLHNQTRSAAAPWREILRTTAERYAAALKGAAASRQAAKNMLNSDRMNQLISYVSDISGNGSSCAIHGDFWTENILEQNGKITAVLDWDRFDPRGLPYLDLFHLLTKHERDSNHGSRFGQAAITVHRERLASDLVTEYTEQLSLPAGLASRCMMLYWLRQAVILLTEDKPVTLTELHEAIEQPLEYFSSVARSQPKP
jgi:ubiquinone/menaquinone biosynthesis C-methylase UbiE/aminoglycoside phosphotransferase (APT) family kinase protein